MEHEYILSKLEISLDSGKPRRTQSFIVVLGGTCAHNDLICLSMNSERPNLKYNSIQENPGGSRVFITFSKSHENQVSLGYFTSNICFLNRSNQTENSNQTTVVELLIPQIVWIILAK